MSDTLKVKLLGKDGFPPERKSALAAGYDIRSAEDGCLDIGSHRAISTQLSVAIPVGYYGRIAPRSGLAYKYGVDILAGVCDSDYRGEIKVIMVNHGRECFRYSKGDRISQLIIEKITTPPVEVVEELDSTERGEGGLGSTGVK